MSAETITDQILPFTEDELLSVIKTIATKVHRSQLQQILVESRLLAKTISREALRRQCPDVMAWLRIVAPKLHSDETRPAALRALVGLLTAYVTKPDLDHRVEGALRKGRNAAERGDLERVRRELDRLRDYSFEIGSPELSNPGIALYLWAGSERARDSISQVMAAQPASEHIESAVDLFEPPDRAISRIERQDRPQSQIVRKLLADLEELSNETPTNIHWNFKEHARNKLPDSSVEWPSSIDVSASVDSLASRIGECIQKLLSVKVTAEKLPPIRRQVDRLKTIVQEVDGLSQQIATAQESFVACMESRLSLAAPELLEEVGRIRVILNDPKIESYPLAEIEKLVKKNRALAEEKLGYMLKIVDQISEAAIFLSGDAREALAVKARHLLFNFKSEELDRLLIETEAKTEEPRRLRQQSRRVSREVIQSILEAPALIITEAVADEIRINIAGGNKEKALAALLRSRDVPMEPDKGSSQGLSSRIRSAPLAASPSSLPSSSVNAELDSDLTKFSPRDRFVRSERLPANAQEMAEFLKGKTLSEIEKGSVAALDFALDILHLAAMANKGRDHWSQLGLTIIAALPAFPVNDANWGKRLSEILGKSLACMDDSTLTNYLENLVTQPNFDLAISERLVNEETAAFVDVVSAAFRSAVSKTSPYLLEDVARGIGSPPWAN